MENNITISVILPIKSAKAKNFDEYFLKAITSLEIQQEKIDELEEKIKELESKIDDLENYR